MPPSLDFPVLSRLLIVLFCVHLAVSQDTITAPQIAHQTEPHYTPEAQKKNLAGTVVISLIVDEHGKPTNMKIVKGLGEGLDEEALKAVAKWRFTPGTKNGEPTPAAMEVKVDFGPKVTPSLISKVEPEYTGEARQAKISGNVVISLTVDAQGLPANLKVLSPLGYGLDQKAMDAVSQWRFKPATKNGVPIPVPAVVEVSFRLCDATASCENSDLSRNEAGRGLFNTAIHQLLGDADGKANPKAAFRTMEQAAAMQFPPAETRLGLFYLQGIGTAVNPAKAFELFELATLHGDAGGMFRLGALYFAGKGVAADKPMAVKLFNRAAQKDDANAEFALGVAQESGAGTEQDLPQAMKWFHKSAEQGMPDAQESLAKMYWTGSAGKEDRVAALEWAILAEKGGSQTAASDVRQYRAAMSPETVAQAEKRADRFKPRAAKPK